MSLSQGDVSTVSDNAISPLLKNHTYEKQNTDPTYHLMAPVKEELEVVWDEK